MPKIISYCTLILPAVGLLLRTALRWYLQPSSINFVASNVDDARLQKIVVQLMTSPESGSSNWKSAMDVLMSSFEKGVGNIELHHRIAGLLKGQAITPEQISQFCQYLREKLFSPYRYIWIGYQVIAQYLEIEIGQDKTTQVIRDFLKSSANSCIDRKSTLTGKGLPYHEVVIDPRDWFGVKFHPQFNNSFLEQFNKNGTPLPEIMIEVLLERIEALRNNHVPLMVRVTGRNEGELPFNFTLELAKRITDKKIFVCHAKTIDVDQLTEKQFAVLAMEDTGKASIEQLSAAYPGCVLESVEVL